MATSSLGAELTPYSATYAAHVYGVPLTMQQTLQQDQNQYWQLKNHGSLLFATVEEQVRFGVDGATVQPLRYDHTNDLNKSRNCHMQFDSGRQTVTDREHGDTPIPDHWNLWDPLSFQIQLRLDLIRNAGAFEQQVYPQVLRGRIRYYLVSNEGEEALETDLGTFHTIKLKQYRPHKDEYTLIWFAKDQDYLILRMQRVEKGKVNYQIDLKQADIDGRPLAAR